MEERPTDQGLRLQNLIKALNLKQKSFARSLGMTQPNISKMINQTHKVSAEAINKITQVYKKANIHWLLTGEGEMFIPELSTRTTDRVEEPAPPYGPEKGQLLYRDVEELLAVHSQKINTLEEKVARLEQEGKKSRTNDK